MKKHFRQDPSPEMTIDMVAAHIDAKPGPRKRKAAALMQVARLMHLVIYQARRGDKDCGYFLGEFLPVLNKQSRKLEEANDTFRRTFARFESAHFSTFRDSGLREVIHRVILDIQLKRSKLELAPYLSPAYRKLTRGAKLAALPDLSPSQDVVDRWTDQVVYPRLKKMAHKLSLDPKIGRLKKAIDQNGNFQISQLRPQIRDTVARIAAVPHRYYSSAP